MGSKQIGAKGLGRGKGHDRDDDDIIDPGHDLHGNGLGLGHRNGDRLLEIAIPENRNFVTDLDHSFRTGLDDDGVSYSISGGLDEDLFTIDPETGELAFVRTADFQSPDWENPADSDGDNVYEVTVKTSVDGRPGGFIETKILVTITDVEEEDPQAGPPALFVIDEDLGPSLFKVGTAPSQTANPNVARIAGQSAELSDYSLVGDDADSLELVLANEDLNPDDGLFEFIVRGKDGQVSQAATGSDGSFDFGVELTVSDETAEIGPLSVELIETS